MAKGRRRNFSVIVIPDDGSSTWEFKVSAFMVRAGWIFASMILVLMLLGGISIWRLNSWSEVMGKIQAENARLRVEAEKVERLSQALERLKDRDQQIRIMLSGSVPLGEASYQGLEEPAPAKPSSAPGAGGAGK